MLATTFPITLRLKGAGLAAWLFAAACHLPFAVMAQEQQATRAGELVWEQDVNAGVAAAGAVIARDVADDQGSRALFVVGSRSGTVIAYDVANGTPVWGPIDIRRTGGAGVLQDRALLLRRPFSRQRVWWFLRSPTDGS